MRKSLSIGILAVAVVALAMSGTFAGGDKSTCGASEKTATKASAEKAASDQWLTKTIAVKGMTCTGCENSLSTALAEAPGVMEVVKVCHTSEEAVVKVDPAVCKDAELTKLITNKGYEAEIVPAVSKSTTVESKGNNCPVTGKSCGDASVHKTSAEKKLEGTK